MDLVWCSIRHITTHVAAAVVQAAVDEELAEGHGDMSPKELADMAKVAQSFYYPLFSLNKFNISLNHLQVW